MTLYDIHEYIFSSKCLQWPPSLHDGYDQYLQCITFGQTAEWDIYILIYKLAILDTNTMKSSTIFLKINFNVKEIVNSYWLFMCIFTTWLVSNPIRPAHIFLPSQATDIPASPLQFLLAVFRKSTNSCQRLWKVLWSLQAK